MCFGVFVLASVYMRYHCNDISYLFNGHFFSLSFFSKFPNLMTHDNLLIKSQSFCPLLPEISSCTSPTNNQADQQQPGP